ncbi:hypothetical protein ACNOYE_17620 [Nannocystaceae bacterium ST9]
MPSPSLRYLVPGLAAVLLACAEPGEPRFEPAVGSLEIVETIPAEGASEVDPLARIDVCLSAAADPRVFDDFSMTLHSGGLTFDAQIELQLFGWRAPGSRSGVATQPWCPGSVVSLTPASPLQPGLVYRVRLRPVARGWAGEPLDTAQEGWLPDAEGTPIWTIEFRVAGDPGDEPPTAIPEPEPGPTLTELFGEGGPFDPERDACSCHREPGQLARARLDLSTPEVAWTGLVLSTEPGTTGFPRVSVRDPSSSALIHELLRDGEGEPLHEVQVAMPPDRPLAFAELVRIARWIDAGAPL